MLIGPRRGDRRAPERVDINPAAIRRVLGDSLVLSRDAGEAARFRVAGTKLCALFGRELRGEPFASIWDADSTAAIGDIIRIVAEEGIGVFAGVAASAHSSEEANADFESSLAPLTQPFWLGMWPAKPLRLGAIKYIAPHAGAGPTSLVGLHAGTRLTVIDGGRP
jgi:hypothetical protein